jgi:hypothetical protein
MPSNKTNKTNNTNNLAYVGDEEEQTRKFIRNRNHAKKDNKLTKDKKSHKKEHQERVAKRVQKKLQERIAKGLEPEETIKYRVPEPKKTKPKAIIFKGHSKRKAQENWNDQWQDAELGETVDLEAAHDEVLSDDGDYFCACVMPGEIEEIELLQYQSTLQELQELQEAITLHTGPLSVNEWIQVEWIKGRLEEKITSYENKQRLKVLKANSIMTLTEYEEKKARLNKVWIGYKAHRIPRHLFDGTVQYDKNVLELEICKLQPVVDLKLSAALKAKIHKWEDYLEQYYAQQEAEMAEYFAQKEAEIEEYRLIQMTEISEQFQNFLSRLQRSQ